MRLLSLAALSSLASSLPNPPTTSHVYLTCRDGLPPSTWPGWNGVANSSTYYNSVQFCSVKSNILARLGGPISLWSAQIKEDEGETEGQSIISEFCSRRCFASPDGQPSKEQIQKFRQDECTEESDTKDFVHMKDPKQTEVPAETRRVLFLSTCGPNRNHCYYKLDGICQHEENWPANCSEEIRTTPTTTSYQVPSKTDPISHEAEQTSTKETPVVHLSENQIPERPESEEPESDSNQTSNLKERSPDAAADALADPRASYLATKPEEDQGGERGPGISGNIGTYPHSHTEQTILSVGCLLLGVTLSIVGSALSWQDKGLGGLRPNNGRDFV